MGFVHVKAKTALGDYYCLNCENWIHEANVRYEEVDEPRGEFWGVPCTEHCVYIFCPICGSDDIYAADELIYEEDEDEQA